MNELDDFIEWLESQHPDTWMTLKLVNVWREKWDDEQRTQRKIDKELWEKYLQEWGRDEVCPVCEMSIYYVQPQPESFPSGASLFVPCHQGCGGLYITNTMGDISSQFIEKGEET